MTFSTFSAMPLNSSNVAVNTQLSVIANGKNMGNILLFGSFGSGKTEIARSMPLWFSTAKGHPSGYHAFHDCTHGLPSSLMMNFAETMCTTPSRVDFMVLDEVDKLPAAQQANTLLTPMTINSAQKIFILTANEIHKVPAAIQSRCLALHIKAPTPTDVLPYVMKEIISKGGTASEQTVFNMLQQVTQKGIDCRDYDRVIKMYTP
jgi:replication-associated recombination protein RarA